MNPVKIWWLSCRAYKKRMPIVAKLLKTLNFVIFKAILPYQAEIERDVVLEHYGLATVIHPNVRIGHRVRIFHHVTLAAETYLGSEFKISVEDDVVIGAGAIVVARPNTNLTIGKGARIGAGAVVTRDVAAGDTVIGIPARSVQTRAGV